MSTLPNTRPVVMLAGSRDLAPGHAAIAPVVSALVTAGVNLVTGCAVGADQLAIRAALALGPDGVAAIKVLAAHGPISPSWSAKHYTAPGAWSGSAVADVAAAMRAGVSVSWWAGGGPDLDLRGRLARRSLAAVRLVAAAGPGSGLVAWPSRLPPLPFRDGPWPSCGSGTWSAVAAAARLGLPVVVIPVGSILDVPLSSWPVLMSGGQWMPVALVTHAGAALWSPPLSLAL